MADLVALLAGLGATDKAFNMLRLNPLLHASWSKGEFALSWFDDAPHPEKCGITVVLLKMHPLKTLAKDEDRYGELTDDLAEEMLSVFDGRLSTHDSTPGASPESSVHVNDRLKSLHSDSPRAPVNSAGMMDFFSHLPVCEGQIVSTEVRNENVENFKLMIQLQYCLTLMAKMAGGANPLEWIYDIDPKSPFASLSVHDGKPATETFEPNHYLSHADWPTALLSDDFESEDTLQSRNDSQLGGTYQSDNALQLGLTRPSTPSSESSKSKNSSDTNRH